MRYFEAFIRRFLALLRLCIVKLAHFNNLKFNLIEIVSFSTKFRISGSGEIILKKNIGSRRNVEFNVSDGATIKVGERCFFNNNCMITSHERIEIGDNCSFGPNVLLYDHDYDYKAPGGKKSLKYKTSPIIIGENVWIGANTVILRGTKIGDNCVIGAGSVIKGEYPSNSIIFSKRDVSIINYNFNECRD